jgi:hypothetical protein
MPGTVTVACRLPHGLVLQHQTERKYSEPTQAGYREVSAFVRTGDKIVINGFAQHVGTANDKQIVGGYALTHGVDADFFAKWLTQNAEHPAVEAGLVFAHEKPAMAEGKAREHRKNASGLEPIDPENLPAEFRRSISTAVVG